VSCSTTQKRFEHASRNSTEISEQGGKTGNRTEARQADAQPASPSRGEWPEKAFQKSLFPHGLVRTRNQKLPNHCLNVARFRTGILSWHRRHLPHLPRLPSYTLVVSVYRLENAVHDIRTVANSEAAAHVLHDHENQL